MLKYMPPFIPVFILMCVTSAALCGYLAWWHIEERQDTKAFHACIVAAPDELEMRRCYAIWERTWHMPPQRSTGY